MKIISYNTYESFVDVTFESKDCKATLTIQDDGEITCEVENGFDLIDLKKAIEIVESGKVVIEL